MQGSDLYAAPLNLPLDQVLYTVVYEGQAKWVPSFIRRMNHNIPICSVSHQRDLNCSSQELNTLKDSLA